MSLEFPVGATGAVSSLSTGLRHLKSILNRMEERRLAKLLDVFMTEVRACLSNDTFIPHFVCMYLDKATGPNVNITPFAQFLSGVVNLTPLHAAAVCAQIDFAITSSLGSVKASSDATRVRNMCSLTAGLVRHGAMTPQWAEKCVHVLLKVTPRSQIHVEGACEIVLGVDATHPISDNCSEEVLEATATYSPDDTLGKECVEKAHQRLRDRRSFHVAHPMRHHPPENRSPNGTSPPLSLNGTSPPLWEFLRPTSLLTASNVNNMNGIGVPNPKRRHIRGGQNLSTDSAASNGSVMSIDSVVSTPREIPQPYLLLNPPHMIKSGIFAGCTSKSHMRTVAHLILSKVLQGTLSHSYGSSRRKLSRWCERTNATKEDTERLVGYTNDMSLAGMKYRESCREEVQVDDRVIVTRGKAYDDRALLASGEFEQGTVCYVGPEGIGCQVDAPTGELTPEVYQNGKVVFTCRARHGILVKRTQIRLLENHVGEGDSCLNPFFYPHKASGRILQFDTRQDSLEILFPGLTQGSTIVLKNQKVQHEAVVVIGLRYGLLFVQPEQSPTDAAELFAKTREETVRLITTAQMKPPNETFTICNYAEQCREEPRKVVTPRFVLGQCHIPVAVRVHLGQYFLWDEAWSGWLRQTPATPAKRLRWDKRRAAREQRKKNEAEVNDSHQTEVVTSTNLLPCYRYMRRRSDMSDRCSDHRHR